MDKLKAITDSLTFRTFLISLIAIAMLIPLFMTQGIIHERNQYYSQTINDISKGWGKQQTVVGPVLVVPYVEHIFSADTITDKDGETRTISRDIYTNKTIILLPEELNIDVKLNEQQRKRGIYSTLLYMADLTITGNFDISSLPAADSTSQKVKWDKAYLSIGLSDTKAITETTPIRWEKASAPLEPGTKLDGILNSGFHASMKNTRRFNSRPDFRIKLSIKGSDGFRFAPLGKVTKANIESGWSHPSFQGDILPNNKANISKDGFNAQWSIPHLARNYPQSWLLEEGKDAPKYDLYALTTGVNLFTPVSIYTKIDRSVKYGALFIGLTFIVFLLFEIIAKIRTHVIQYILIGVSLSLFYLILVSLSEHLPFLMSYAYAAATTIGIITLYSAAVLKSFSRAIMIFLLLGSLYGVLFFILQMEDFALLAGTALITLIIMIMMFATRHLQK
ncbi:MAG TPA: cell envelope integrity protein CreD [Leucothrix mucor]|nr:cell envelope integrity protein CreD [Leucothrix mucor]